MQKNFGKKRGITKKEGSSKGENLAGSLHHGRGEYGCASEDGPDPVGIPLLSLFFGGVWIDRLLGKRTEKRNTAKEDWEISAFLSFCTLTLHLSSVGDAKYPRKKEKMHKTCFLLVAPLGRSALGSDKL